jgi:uncharacterized membrane protein
MERFESSIVVDCPVRTVYNQWTQFEEFPRFMEGVEEVRQLDDTHQHWRAKIGGKTKEWDAELTEQVPDQRISWRSLSGAPSAGTVNFTSIDDGNRTQLSLEMQYETQGVTENIGDALGVVTSHVKRTLEDFKEFIEGRRGQGETGAWRGEIHGGHAEKSPQSQAGSGTASMEKPAGASSVDAKVGAADPGSRPGVYPRSETGREA